MPIIIDFNNRREYVGLQSELNDLPVDCECGSTFYAVDTKKTYIFYVGTWYEM